MALGGASSRPEAVRGGGSRQLIQNCYSVTSSEREEEGKGEEGRGRASSAAQLQKKGGSLRSSSISGAKGGRKEG